MVVRVGSLVLVGKLWIAGLQMEELRHLSKVLSQLKLGFVHLLLQSFDLELDLTCLLPILFLHEG